MEGIGKITGTFTNQPTGAIVGGVSGYLISRYFKGNILITVPIVLVCAIIGSGIEWKIRNGSIEDILIKKEKDESKS